MLCAPGRDSDRPPHQANRAIQFSRDTFRFSLQFDEALDFWEVTRIIADAHASRELFKKQIEDLHVDALRHVPTLAGGLDMIG